jgi:hypothetical protein
MRLQLAFGKLWSWTALQRCPEQRPDGQALALHVVVGCGPSLGRGRTLSIGNSRDDRTPGCWAVLHSNNLSDHFSLFHSSHIFLELWLKISQRIQSCHIPVFTYVCIVSITCKSVVFFFKVGNLCKSLAQFIGLI